MSEPKLGAWRVPGVNRRLGEPEDAALERACEVLGLSRSDVVDWSIARRSIDARGNRPPRFVLSVEVHAPEQAVSIRQPKRVHAVKAPRLMPRRSVPPESARPIVVGMGPCGLFAALQLAEAGLRPIVIDRGKPVETRAKDVARLMGRGEIDPESNLCFGEGGAGTWSDGKLYTRVGGPRVREVLETIVRMGGPDRILVDSRPHLGTDRLVALLKQFRAALGELGCDLHFESRVASFIETDGRATGVVLDDGTRIDGTHVIMAVGHSARDVYRGLVEVGVAMERKPFAVGFRIEHPQALINEIQYGRRWAGNDELPAAYYELSARADVDRERGIYSFCMCPGGSVVPTPTSEGEVCVNGMSHAARSGRYANSALVVQVEPEDWSDAVEPDTGESGLLAGVAFQRAAERQAWTLGGGAFVAPAQRVTDYLAGRPSSTVRRTTYKRGVTAVDLEACYPGFVHEALRAALRRFDRKMRGYLTDEAVLIGVETRTSAPVTVLRDGETFQSPSVARLYPAGEGAGFGGGIVSAAIDGLRVANRILDELEGGNVAESGADS